MKALELQALTGPDGLFAADRPEPEAGDGCYLIDVRAAGVSFPDLLVTRGAYQEKPELPAVPGLEVAGVVRSAPEASPLAAGTRVWASLGGGGFAAVAAAPVTGAFALPDALSFEEGAALPVNYLTAVFALVRRGRLTAGETVLVLGAAGGLGTALCGVAAHLGARVMAVVSSEAKRATAEAAGAERVLVGDRWRDDVLAGTGSGADLCVDPVGGQATVQAVRAVRPEGRVVTLGFASGEIPAVPANRLLLRNVDLIGAGLGALVPRTPNLLQECAERLAPLLDDGLRPVIDRILPLEQGADGLRALEGRAVRGKIVLTVTP